MTGSFAEAGIHTLSFSGHAFVFEVLEKPSAGEVAFATTYGGGMIEERLVSNFGDLVSSVTLEPASLDTTVKCIAENIPPGAPSNKAISSPERRSVC